MSAFAHLTREQLCALLEDAMALMPVSQRRAFLATMPPPPDPPPLTEETFDRVVGAADALRAFLDSEPDAAAAWIGDDYRQDERFNEECYALEADLDEALERAVAWLATQQPSEVLGHRLAQVLDALDALMAWECPYREGITYGELDCAPKYLQPLRTWTFLLGSVDWPPAELAADLATEWPHPVGASLLDAALGPRAAEVRAALREQAVAGDAGAARWLLLDGPDDPEMLTRYAHLAADLGRRWALCMVAAERWQDLVAGPERGIEVPEEPLYQARIRLGLHEAAFRGMLASPSYRLTLETAWDDAVAVGKLDLLRRLARESARPEARWVALDEPELLVLPAKYDHEEVKKVVSYAIARATRGALRSAAISWALSPELLQRLATLPGPHDEARCVVVALDGLERLIAAHIAGRSRNRYARAAAYWVQHGELCAMFDRKPRHDALRSTFALELHRLPALRDELTQARAAWR